MSLYLLLNDVLITDVLNRIYPSWLSKAARDLVIPDAREQMEHARDLAKYVFPRQYDLENPFVMSATLRYNAMRPDWMDRDVEIKVSQTL